MKDYIVFLCEPSTQSTFTCQEVVAFVVSASSIEEAIEEVATKDDTKVWAIESSLLNHYELDFSPKVTKVD